MADAKDKLRTRGKDVSVGDKFPEGREKTVLRALGLSGGIYGGAPCAVEVKDGRIVRIRPLHYDWKYDGKQFNPWKIKRKGKTLEPLMKSLPSPFTLAYKKRVYSANRIKYPLKRVDWDPNGERNPQNRGKSKYKRISWDEAINIVVSELKRVREKYGPFAVFVQGDGHGECKTIHGPHGCQAGLLSKMESGNFTVQVRNPDSWEGWYWGAKFVWGNMEAGLQLQQTNLVNDVLNNTDMIIYWGGDPHTTSPHTPGFYCNWFLQRCMDVGIKKLFVCPDLNYTANTLADKWIPILPNTDAALLLAIAYMWITEGTYDKEYIATHAVGFDKFSDYVLGKTDGVPKTPAWASPKCDVPEWTIKALAREMAKKVTSILGGGAGGGAIRGPYSHEPARLIVCLLGMMGLGKPGVNQMAAPWNQWPRPVVYLGAWQDTTPWTGMNFDVITKQCIPKTLVHEAILNPPINTWGCGGILMPTEDQFVKYTYPIPKEEGGTEIHMLWSDAPCRITCWNNGFRTVEAARSPKMECIVVQHPWLENETLFADIILPVSTKLELKDISLCTLEPLRALLYEDKCIDNVGESKSDYEIVCEVAKKLGLAEEYTGGLTVDERIEKGYRGLQVDNYISWEELKKKGYWSVPASPDWEKDPPGLIDFYRDPENNPLETPSGKLEFYSEILAKHFPDDKERPPVPSWIEGGPGWTHDERRSGKRFKKYPLLFISNHPHWRMHAQCDDISWFREVHTCRIRGYDGYQYEPIWMHPSDAEKRGIKNGDIVKIYNERGIVLGGAYVSERIMPGALSQDHGARADLIAAGPDEFIDRGGSNNLISPLNPSSKNTGGQATSGFLVEVEKLDPAEMEEWRRKYPEAFERDYDPASGLHFNAWVEGGMKSVLAP